MARKRITLNERRLGSELITNFMEVKSRTSKGNSWHGLKQWFTGLPASYVKSGGSWDWDDVSYQRRKKFQFKDLRYDCDWSWLMPVIDKIDAIQDIHFSYDVHKSSGVNQYKVKVFGLKPDAYYPLWAFVDVTDEDKLTAHYKAVVEFLLFRHKLEKHQEQEEDTISFN